MGFDRQSVANQTLDRCSSTNYLAKSLAEKGYPHGTWVSTRIQESGRGRMGRKWESAEGNLFLSIIVRIENKNVWSWVPLTTAVGITRFLRTNFPGINFQVKWPNDLWLYGKKLGGILCEGFGPQTRPSIIVGIGLNCLFSPEGLDQPVIDLTTALGRGPLAADPIRDEIRLAILNEIDHLAHHGPESIAKSFEEWSAFPPGTEVEWGTPPQKGKIQRLGPSGELIVQTPQAESVRLFAEDIKLRFR